MKSLYPDIAELPLYVAGAFEQKVPGGIFGPTCNDVMQKQLVDWRKGDRYVPDTHIDY